MKEPQQNINDVKTRIMNLKGKGVEMQINHGRKKIKTYSGVVEDVYSSVFVVKLDCSSVNQKATYSYSDILCGDVKIALKR